MMAPAMRAGADWVRTARVFLIDGYQPPFAPELEFDAEALAKTMTEMNANVVRMSTMGKYAHIQGISFTPHRALGKRDLLREMIAAAKPRGIRVIPYISTGHKLAWSMVTKEYPEYGHRPRPDGQPDRSHMFVGEDHGTVCWNTPYRKAFMDMVEHIVRDYEIDGVYFDTWRPFYFWQGMRLCYCDGCRNGFRAASGKEIPYHEKRSGYTKEELETVDRYHAWYRERFIGIIGEVRRLVKSYRDIPLIYNINHARQIAEEDPRIIGAMDAFLYERGNSLLERAEGVSLARAAGIGVWPYIGVYNNWPRVIYNNVDYQQEIYTTAMFGGAPIIAQPYAYVDHTENRRFVGDPFSMLKAHEKENEGFENEPYVAVVYGHNDPPGYARSDWFWKTDARTNTLGAFAACLHGHVQVSSAPEQIMDEPEKLERYKVVYLAGTPHVSARRAANLKRFVETGGGLVVSYGTSLYGADGARQTKFGIEELVRVKPATREGKLAEILASYQSMLGGPNDLYLLARGGAMAGKLIPLTYFEPVEVLDGGDVAMDVVTGDGRRRVLPGVVLSRHGKGKVVYGASSLEGLYVQESLPVLRDYVSTMIRLVCPEAPPFEADAPPTLVFNLTRKDRRRVLHITNWSVNSERGGGSLAPAENVRVRLRVPEGKEVAGAAVFGENGRAGTVKNTPRAVELNFPKLEAYRGAVIEFR
jgi:hypothetical protein